MLTDFWYYKLHSVSFAALIVPCHYLFDNKRKYEYCYTMNSFKNNTYDIKMLNMKFVLNLTNFCFITSCYDSSIA